MGRPSLLSVGLVLLTMPVMLRPRRRPSPSLIASLLAASVLAAAGLTSAAAAAARPDSGADRRIEELQHQVGEASREEAAALREMSDVRAKRAQLDATVRDLDARVADAGGRLQAAQAEADRVGAHYRELERRVDAAQADLDAARGAFGSTVARLYRDGGNGAGAYLSFVLGSSAHEMTVGQRYLRDLSGAHHRQIKHISELRRTAAEARDRLTGERQQVEAARADAARETDRLRSLRSQQEPARAAAAVQEAQENDLLGRIRAREAEFNGELAALQSASSSVTELLRNRPNGPAPAPVHLLRPVAGPITSPFGPRVHPIFGTIRMHTGVDFGAATGTPIHAAAAGIVVWAGPQGGYGNAVIIDHGGGLATLYAHQSRVGVSVGQHVSANQVIGYVGSTGYATGPHLHFEVRVHGNPVDPMGYL